jgi:hypothetical protein
MKTVTLIVGFLALYVVSVLATAVFSEDHGYMRGILAVPMQQLRGSPDLWHHDLFYPFGGDPVHLHPEDRANPSCDGGDVNMTYYNPPCEATTESPKPTDVPPACDQYTNADGTSKEQYGLMPRNKCPRCVWKKTASRTGEHWLYGDPTTGRLYGSIFRSAKRAHVWTACAGDGSCLIEPRDFIGLKNVKRGIETSVNPDMKYGDSVSWGRCCCGATEGVR